ncbi:MAG: mycothione reductase [Nakamurella sp.]
MSHYDLVIIGTGSGNSIPGPEFDHWNIAIVENGTFGGTCLNVGCIPSKMFEYPAEIADGLRGAEKLGIEGHIDRVDWPAIRDRIFGRIDPIAASGKRYREGSECPNITVYTGTGRFTGDKRLSVTLVDGSSAELSADRFVLAAGSRAVVPAIPGLDTVTHHTSDTVMRINEVPRRVLIYGGGYIGAEFSHIFASLGASVTHVTRGQKLLRHLDNDVAQRYTDISAARYDVRLSSTITSVKPSPTMHDAILAELTGANGMITTVETDLLLIATGRRPNGDELGVRATGVELNADGYVEVDEHQQTRVPGIWALGDISSRYQLKHVANHEARVVKHNLAHPDEFIAADHRFVPAAVFTHPQVATVGMTEHEALSRGIDVAVARRDYGGVAAGWAREDVAGFCKVLADPATGLLLGVHIIGPEAATIIQPALTAMQFGIPAHELALGQYWIHPALPELLENALLGLPAPTGP